ncbi:MAG TPA: GAF and ANTAR domain-containing protein [Arthrobacter sp.]|nr:GAF and ANTAR domain-containing protein [Arthrobacter sp.]
MRRESVTGELQAVFARISGLLLTEHVAGPAITKIAQAAFENTPGSIGAGATLIDAQGRPTSRASTSALVEEADQLQYEFGEGPCLSAWAGASTVRTDDATTETRWPKWSEASARRGLLSCLSVPLLLPGGNGTGPAEAIGTLKVYAYRPNAFDAGSERLLELLATPAAIMLANIQSHESAEKLSAALKESLHSRSVIDMAKGVLIERLQLDERAALRALTKRSRQEGAPLVAVALNVLDRPAEPDLERP